MIPTATVGCFRRSLRACRVASIRRQRRLRRSRISPTRCAAPKQRTANTKSASANGMRTGPTGTRNIWLTNSLGKSCRNKTQAIAVTQVTEASSVDATSPAPRPSKEGSMSTPAVAPQSQRVPQLLGQTVVVIGGSAGIGLETARQARAEGAKLILAGRNAERLQAAATELEAESTKAFDAVDAGALEQFFRDLPGPIDHVMVTAGRPFYGRLMDMDFAEARCHWNRISCWRSRSRAIPFTK